MTFAETTIEVHPSKQSLSDAAAVRFLAAVREAVRTRGVAQVALTGGSMGSAIFASLLQTPGHGEVDWSQVYVWWGDERYLPAGDPDRNDTQNDEAGMSQLGLDGGTVFRVEGPDASAALSANAQILRLPPGCGWLSMTYSVLPSGVTARPLGRCTAG